VSGDFLPGTICAEAPSIRQRVRENPTLRKEFKTPTTQKSLYKKRSTTKYYISRERKEERTTRCTGKKSAVDKTIVYRMLIKKGKKGKRKKKSKGQSNDGRNVL